MKRFQRIALALSASMLMAGCQLTSSEPIEPSTSEHLVEVAKQELSEFEMFKVSDNGLITYTARLPGPGYYWKPARIKEISYEISCIELSYFVDRGLVVKSEFLGKRGRVEYYDMERCEQDTPFQ